MGKVAVRKKSGTALVSMQDLERMYADEAKEAVQSAPVVGGIQRISANDQMFKIGETDLPDPLDVIVVAESLLNVYYDSEYEPGVQKAPACFATGPVGKNAEAQLVAHESSPDRQGGAEHKCQTCELNKFGSAEKGKGKACANTRQLAVVMADDPALTGDGELLWAVLSLSATALTPWGKYVQALDQVHHRPPHGVVTRFSFDRKNKNERARKAVIAVGHRLMALRESILANNLLTRPLPVDNYEKPGAKPKVKAPAKTKATSARGRTARV